MSTNLLKVVIARADINGYTGTQEEIIDKIKDDYSKITSTTEQIEFGRKIAGFNYIAELIAFLEGIEVFQEERKRTIEMDTELYRLLNDKEYQEQERKARERMELEYDIKAKLAKKELIQKS